MKEVNFPNIKPIADPRTPEKSKPGAEVVENRFQQTLESEVARVTELNSQALVNVREGDSSALKEGLDTAKDVFDKLMLAKHNLSQLYQSMKTETPDDKA